MAYPSNYFQRTWQYDPAGTGFQDKVGQLLSGGLDLKASMRASALASVGHVAEFEKQHKGRTGHTPPIESKFYQQTAGSGRGTPVEMDGKGFLWVDGKGQFIDTLGASPTSCNMLPAVSATQQRPHTVPSTLTRSQQLAKLCAAQTQQALYQTMAPDQRTCYTWRRINPACMESCTRPPVTSMKAHYQYDPAKVENVDRRAHLKKTDFSEYTETKARVMHHIQ